MKIVPMLLPLCRIYVISTGIHRFNVADNQI